MKAKIKSNLIFLALIICLDWCLEYFCNCRKTLNYQHNEGEISSLCPSRAVDSVFLGQNFFKYYRLFFTEKKLLSNHSIDSLVMLMEIHLVS